MSTKFLSKCVILLTILIILSTVPRCLTANASPSINLEQFRWKDFPLDVQVDMNQWSLPQYAPAVHDALESWLVSIGNYSESYNDTTFSNSAISFNYYYTNVNSTGNYDVLISFVASEIQPGQGVVGLTTFRWTMPGHDPERPITINITTYSGTASSLFVKNIAMHEFGHALGLGHANSLNTDDGAELMYSYTSWGQTVFPSTLDIYGLARLYHGDYGQSIQLPPTIPYIQLATGTPPSFVLLGPDLLRFLLIVIVIALILVGGAVLILAAVRRRRLSQESDHIDVPPPPNGIQQEPLSNLCSGS